ncbi:PrsW family glutamic-type intramembrane protease [Actinoallomurus acaciae]|uniref:PrsW family glutamic-type intramembrane protease n=1 Tax=Actinoallomurus acaciae TaxID=502577 RepID=A0ABV5YJU2_9ACTN
MTDGPQVHALVRDDALARGRALLIARLMIAVYLVELLLNFYRPHITANEPTLSIFQKLPGASGSLGRLLSLPPTIFWTVLAGIVAGVAIQGLAMITRPEGRRAVVLTWVTLALLLGPFTLIPLTIVLAYPVQALVCVPGTAFVLLLLHGGQRFARMPLPVLLVAFGWGALVVFGLGRAYSGLAFGTLNGYMGKPSGSLGSQIKNQYRAIDLIILHLSVVNALLVAAGVLLLFVLFRHRVTDAVTGLVLGAAAGLGYNLMESVLFIRIWGSLGTFIGGATGGFEYYVRQTIGLLGGQVAFGAVLGAGLGVAVQARQRRALIGVAAVVAAIGAAAGTETLAAWFSRGAHDHLASGGAFDTLIVSPVLWLLPQAPFILLAAVLLILGRRTRAAAARTAVTTEASGADPAITQAEAPFLTDPALRLWAVVSTWRSYGQPAALALLRLQSAQLDLAAWRWQERDSADEPLAREEGNRLRARVMRLKRNPGTQRVMAP